RDHAADVGSVLEDALPAHLGQAQAAHRGAVVLGVPGKAADELHSKGCHAVYAPCCWGRISSSSLPRTRAIWSGLRSRRRPSRAALTTLCGFREPCDLVRMLRIPTASSTARTDPPAMTPVPSPAGLSSTRPAPKWPSTSCGMVLPASGTLKRFFFACSPPLRMASGTSFALPRPAPTCPWPSPTTTSAEKLNRRPPLTTLATRLMWTTLSFSSGRSFGLIVAAFHPPVRRPCIAW